MRKAFRQRGDQGVEERRICRCKVLEPDKPQQTRKNPYRVGQGLGLTPKRRLQHRSLPDGQTNKVGRLEMLLEKRKQRRIHRNRLPRSEITPDSIRRSTRRQKGKVRTTRRKKSSKASIRISKGRADPLEPREVDRRRGRNRGAEETLEKSTWGRGRRSSRSTRSLRKKIHQKGQHLP